MSGVGHPPPERPVHGDRRLVTVDLDDAVPLDAYRAVATLRDAGAGDVEVRVSSSGEGFHVRGWVDADEFDAEGVERLRLAAGDHPKRTMLDRTHRLKPPQMLFTRKPGREAGPWHDDPAPAAAELRRRSDRYGLAGWSR